MRKISIAMTTLRILIIAASILGLASCSLDASMSTPNFGVHNSQSPLVNSQFSFSHRLKDCAHFSEIPGSSASSSGERARIPGTV